MLMHAVALRLGKTIGQIEAMPYREFIDWLAYLEITNTK